MKKTSLASLIKKSRILIVCGTGGVGKTTMSAALGLAGTLMGRRTCVLTIDPARRLATSLGLENLHNDPRDLTEKLTPWISTSQSAALGRFLALMPETQATFERLLKKLAGPEPQIAERIFKTNIYRVFSQEFSGSHEYMAMEKLHEIAESSHPPDLIILDTPPSVHTKVFLEAPEMLAGFFEDSTLRKFSSSTSRWLASGIHKIVELIERLTGPGFLTDFIEFTAGMFALRNQFVKNVAKLKALFLKSDVHFLMVSTPERHEESDVVDFVSFLRQQGFSFDGFIMNKVLPLNWQRDLQKNYDHPELLPFQKNMLQRINHQEDLLSQLKNQENVYEIPLMNQDVHSLEDLLLLGQKFTQI